MTWTVKDGFAHVRYVPKPHGLTHNYLCIIRTGHLFAFMIDNI